MSRPLRIAFLNAVGLHMTQLVGHPMTQPPFALVAVVVDEDGPAADERFARYPGTSNAGQRKLAAEALRDASTESVRVVTPCSLTVNIAVVDHAQ